MEPDGVAVVYCRGAFATANGKTAHGLVRFTRRYRVAAVLDDRHEGRDAGEVLDGCSSGIPVLGSLEAAMASARERGLEPTHFVVGLAPDGGRLEPGVRAEVREAIESGLNVDSGLHDYVSDDPELAPLARERGVVLRDVRRPPDRDELHFYSGKIEEVEAFTVALLGTDSAVGKRTTAWKLVHALEEGGHTAEMVGTGQTAWMQGASHGIVLDSLVNDFVAGEIEHAVWSAWKERCPEVIVIEGQGSLMNPAYPGGFEILAAGRPDVVVLQHAPARRDYDGFPGHRLHALPHQIQAVEIVSGRPVVAVAVNHEEIAREDIPVVCRTLSRAVGLPVFDVLSQGAAGLAEAVLARRK
jgi:uncharacterized NAD-dependent epimerase/dehydratase family protein